jgi:hypothetical protein
MSLKMLPPPPFFSVRLVLPSLVLASLALPTLMESAFQLQQQQLNQNLSVCCAAAQKQHS